MKKLLTLLLLSPLAFAEEIDWSKYKTEADLKGLTEEQINSMPFSVLQRFMGNDMPPEALDYLSVISLSRLGYFIETNPRVIKEKIKSFQETTGTKPTGELTFGDFNKLNECNAKFVENKVIPLAGSSVTIWEDWASAEASIVIDDGNDTYLQETDSAYPITKSEIRCDKQDGICRVFVADIVVPRFGDSNDTYYLSTNIEIWDIDSWGTDKIIASQGSECRTTTMTMNSTTNEIVQTTTNASNEGCDILGTELPKLDRPTIATSVDPMEYGFGYWAARTKKTSEMCVSQSVQDMAKEAIGQND